VSVPEKFGQELIKFVRREQSVELEQQVATSLLHRRALVALGYAIEGLSVVSITNDGVILSCASNESRFRVSDHLTFELDGKKSFRGILTGFAQGGRELQIAVEDRLPDAESGPWFATENSVNLANLVIGALEKLQPGGAGWGLVIQLSGIPQPALPALPPLRSLPTDLSLLYQQMVEDSGRQLDGSQQAALHRCLTQPPILGVQGPPGTGKTTLLGFVAEALVRMDRQIVILAFTHQAVNTALSEIHSIFPHRRVVKVGDELRTDSLSNEIEIIGDARVLRGLPPDTIVGMTYMASLQRLMVRDNRPLNPHVVIIDEAGQLPLAQGITAGLCGAGSVLLFGDDRQMPPVFSSNLSEEPLAISIFAQLRRSRPEAILMLDTTYRMNQDLCQVVGRAFYSDGAIPLQPAPVARDRRLDGQFADRAATAIVRQALSPDKSLVWLKVNTQKYMQANPEEASAVVDILHSCLQAGMMGKEVAVVTPFRRQAMLIRNLLSQVLGEDAELPIIDTVERVQGTTVDLVVVSFCASQPDYVTSLANFLFSPNRLNVAASRARRKAIVVSSPDLFSGQPLDHQGIVGRNRCRSLLEQAYPIMVPGG
jgi:hypothetical protein